MSALPARPRPPFKASGIAALLRKRQLGANRRDETRDFWGAAGAQSSGPHCRFPSPAPAHHPSELSNAGTVPAGQGGGGRCDFRAVSLHLLVPRGHF